MDWKGNFKWLTMHKLKFPIHNGTHGTLKRFILPSIIWTSKITILNADFFKLKFLYKSDWRISTTGKHFRIKLLSLGERHYFAHCWSHKGFKGTVVNRAFSSVNGGSHSYAYILLNNIAIHTWVSLARLIMACSEFKLRLGNEYWTKFHFKSASDPVRELILNKISFKKCFGSCSGTNSEQNFILKNASDLFQTSSLSNLILKTSSSMFLPELWEQLFKKQVSKTGFII